MEEQNLEQPQPTKKAKGRPFLNPHSFGVKIALISLLLLCFQIPMRMIEGTLEERVDRKEGVEADILNTRGGEVRIGGPVLVVPREWEITRWDRDNDTSYSETRREYITILPRNLDIRATADSRVKSRGIYSVPLFDLLLEGRGNFHPGEALEPYPPEQILWEEAAVQFSAPSLKGVRRLSPLLWNGEEQSFEPGSPGWALYPGGALSAKVSLTGDKSQNYTFQFSQEIQGGKSLRFFPLAEETLITLDSDWASPSFEGYYLPTRSDRNDRGFSAEWEINYLSRSIPQSWSNMTAETSHEAWKAVRATSFGVQFFPVVTSYDKIHRTMKYGLLFLLLPFLTFFLFEVIRKYRIHPVQYILAGTGNLLFYLLLLSLSEHIAFNGAYLLAALGVTLMLTVYAMSVLRARRSGLSLLPVTGLSYGYLYFVLQSEDYALLMGSLGLFGLISLVMFLTRRVEWYRREED